MVISEVTLFQYLHRIVSKINKKYWTADMAAIYFGDYDSIFRSK